jgi:conjugative transfer region protein TrbK
MDAKLFARTGAIVFVAIAITATAIEATRKERPSESWSPRRPTTEQGDPLRAELLRCQALGEAGPRDPACLHAWALNRNRFLAPGARPQERLDVAQPALRPAPTSAPASEAR